MSPWPPPTPLRRNGHTRRAVSLQRLLPAGAVQRTESRAGNPGVHSFIGYSATAVSSCYAKPVASASPGGMLPRASSNCRMFYQPSQACPHCKAPSAPRYNTIRATRSRTQGEPFGICFLRLARISQSAKPPVNPGQSSRRRCAVRWMLRMWQTPAPYVNLAYGGGSVCLNGFRGWDRWISAADMLRPGMAAAGQSTTRSGFAGQGSSAGPGVVDSEPTAERGAPPRHRHRCTDRSPRT